MATKATPTALPTYDGVNMASSEGTSAKELAEHMIDKAGFGFSFGIIGGSLYHISKTLCKIGSSPITSSSSILRAGVDAVRTKAPCICGSAAALNLVFNALFIGIDNLRGSETKLDELCNLSLSEAATGAIMFASRGLRSASSAAFAMAAIPPATDALLLLPRRFLFDSEVRNYSYPHYVLHHQPPPPSTADLDPKILYE